MDEPFLPWWLVLLLGMWAVALTLWQHPSIHREVRLWAGLSTLVYLGLIFLALGSGPRGIASGPSLLASIRVVEAGRTVCIVVSLAASVWMLGRISARSRRICYIVLTVSNAGFCALVQGPEIAIGLVVVAGLEGWSLIRERTQPVSWSPREWLVDLFRFNDEPAAKENVGQFWLIGGMNGILACVLIGTLAYSLRIETTRTNFSPRYTALPSREHLDRIHSRPNSSTDKTPLLELAFGQRSDIVVLMATIVFLCLAISLNDLPRQKPALTESESRLSSEVRHEDLT